VKRFCDPCLVRPFTHALWVCVFLLALKVRRGRFFVCRHSSSCFNHVFGAMIYGAVSQQTRPDGAYRGLWPDRGLYLSDGSRWNACGRHNQLKAFQLDRYSPVSCWSFHAVRSSPTRDCRGFRLLIGLFIAPLAPRWLVRLQSNSQKGVKSAATIGLNHLGLTVRDSINDRIFFRGCARLGRDGARRELSGSTVTDGAGG
jgi:hypothetical protein